MPSAAVRPLPARPVEATGPSRPSSATGTVRGAVAAVGWGVLAGATGVVAALGIAEAWVATPAGRGEPSEYPVVLAHLVTGLGAETAVGRTGMTLYGPQLLVVAAVVAGTALIATIARGRGRGVPRVLWWTALGLASALASLSLVLVALLVADDNLATMPGVGDSGDVLRLHVDAASSLATAALASTAGVLVALAVPAGWRGARTSRPAVVAIAEGIRAGVGLLLVVFALALLLVLPVGLLGPSTPTDLTVDVADVWTRPSLAFLLPDHAARLAAAATGAGVHPAWGTTTALYSDPSTFLVVAFVTTLLVSAAVGVQVGFRLPQSEHRWLTLAVLPVAHTLAWLTAAALVAPLRSGTDVGALTAFALLHGAVAAVAATALAPVLLRSRFGPALTPATPHPDVSDHLRRTLDARGRTAAAHIADPGHRGARWRRTSRQSLVVLSVGGALSVLTLALASPQAAARGVDRDLRCDTPWSCRAADDVPPVSSEPVGEHRVAIETAAAALAAAETERAAVLAELPPTIDDMRTAIATTRAALSSERSDLAEAVDELGSAETTREAQGDTSFEEEMLADAQDSYDQFSAYDDDGFWSDMVDDAESALAERRAELAPYDEAITEAEAARDEHTAEIDRLEAELTALEAGYAPYEEQAERAGEIGGDLQHLEAEVAVATTAWEAHRAELNEQREIDQAYVADTRTWGRRATTALGLAGATALVALVAAAAVTPRSRRQSSARSGSEDTGV